MCQLPCEESFLVPSSLLLTCHSLAPSGDKQDWEVFSISGSYMPKNRSLSPRKRGKMDIRGTQTGFQQRSSSFWVWLFVLR